MAGETPAVGSAPAAGSPAAGSAPAAGKALGSAGEGAGKAPASPGSAPEGGQKPPEGANPPAGGKKPGESAAAAAKRMLKAIVDGKEVEVEEEAAIRAFQKEKASEKRFGEASALKKQAEQFLQQLKRGTSDPRVMAEIIKKIDPEKGDFRKIAEDYLYQLIQDEQLSPEQKELKAAREKLAEVERQEQERIEAEKNQQASELQQKFTKEYQTDIIGALEQSGLPKTEYTVARMARYMHMALVRGVELKAADVVDFVWKDYQRDLGAFRSLPAEKLLDMIGPELADKIREFDLAKLRNGGGSAPADTTKPPIPGESKEFHGKKEPLTKDEFRERARQRAEM